MQQEIYSRPWYVYYHAYPDGRKFYIGKGTGKRLFDHEAEARTDCECEKCQVIRGIWASGGFVQKGFLFETFDETEALQWEKKEIAENDSPWLLNIHGRPQSAWRPVLTKSVATKLVVTPLKLSDVPASYAADHCDMQHVHFAHYSAIFGLKTDEYRRYQMEDLTAFQAWMDKYYPGVGWHNETSFDGVTYIPRELLEAAKERRLRDGLH